MIILCICSYSTNYLASIKLYFEPYVRFVLAYILYSNFNYYILNQGIMVQQVQEVFYHANVGQNQKHRKCFNVEQSRVEFACIPLFCLSLSLLYPFVQSFKGRTILITYRSQNAQKSHYSLNDNLLQATICKFRISTASTPLLE